MTQHFLQNKIILLPLPEAGEGPCTDDSAELPVSSLRRSRHLGAMIVGMHRTGDNEPNRSSLCAQASLATTH
jgi:hypothetical protein